MNKNNNNDNTNSNDNDGRHRHHSKNRRNKNVKKRNTIITTRMIPALGIVVKTAMQRTKMQ